MQVNLGPLKPFLLIDLSVLLTLLVFHQFSLPVLVSPTLQRLLIASTLATATSWAIWLILANVLSAVWSAKNPGMLVHTLLFTLSGSLSSWLLALAFPGSSHLSGFAASIPIALASTLMVWCVTYLAGNLKPGQTFWPQY